MMRFLLTTQSQNCYQERIQKEMLTRLAWKNRYAKLYPSCCPDVKPQSHGEVTQLPRLPTARSALPPVSRTLRKTPPLPPPPGLPVEQQQQQQQQQQQHPSVVPTMRAASPGTRQTLFQDSSEQGRGRSLYLQRRGHLRPEDKFDFPLLSSWEYGWRLGDYSVDYRRPVQPRLSVVKSTFYAKNGVFSCPSATDALG